MLAESRSIQTSGIPLVQIRTPAKPRFRRLRWAGVVASAALILGIMVWQGVKAGGNPDPTVKGINPVAAVVDTGILVFREGLEAILVLAALTASLVRTEEGYWKPVALGAGVSFLATIVTWFIAVALLSVVSADTSLSMLDIQAGTGLLAIAVLLVIMNWFFHKIYWTGWITHHNRRKRNLTESVGRSRRAIFRGLALIGFTSVYREGFEVVLFLQTLRLRAGSHVVFEGVLIGLALTGIVAMLTFVLQYRLPYKRMLVFTGILLGAVLLVMVGESVQEMPQANWIGATTLGSSMPDWMNTWFAVFPTAQSLIAQALTAGFVIGSFYLARRVCAGRHVNAASEAEVCIVPDCANCTVAGAEHPSDSCAARD